MDTEITIKPTSRQLIEKAYVALNSRLHGGKCPGAGAMGECPACYEVDVNPHTGDRHFVAHVYIWKAGRELKAAEIAQWLKNAGFKNLVVSHHLHDDWNEIFDGAAEDGAISWLVDFSE